jgi:hypothetical protein
MGDSVVSEPPYEGGRAWRRRLASGSGGARAVEGWPDRKMARRSGLDRWLRAGALVAGLAAAGGGVTPAAHGESLFGPMLGSTPEVRGVSRAGAEAGSPASIGAAPARQDPEATLDPVRPEVEWSEVGLTSWRSVPNRQPVVAGDRVRTGSGAAARLLYFEGSVIELAPNTGLLVQRLERSASGDLISNLFLTVGSLVSRIVPQAGTGGGFEIETPAAIGRARGTTPRAEVTRDGTTIISNLPDNTGGLVNVEGKDPLSTQVTVRPGYQTLIRPGQPPTEPYPILREFRIRYCSTPVCAP